MSLTLSCSGERPNSVDLRLGALANALRRSDNRAIVTVRVDTTGGGLLDTVAIGEMARNVAARHGLTIDRVFSVIPAFTTTVRIDELPRMFADSDVVRIEADRTATIDDPQ